MSLLLKIKSLGLLTEWSIKNRIMSPRTSKQFADIREEKKKLIKDTALELFAANGFHSTSINQIAQKANISKGLTYNYFKSKNDILIEIIEDGFNEISDIWDPNHDGIITDEEFAEFIDQVFTIFKSNLNHWKLFFSLMLQPAVLDNFNSTYMEIVAPMLQTMQEYIAAKGSDNPEGDLMIISAMLEGAFLYVIIAPDLFDIDIMKQNIIRGINRILNTNL